MDLAAEPLECLQKERLNKVGLEALRVGALHLLPYLPYVRSVHVIVHQGTLGQKLLEVIPIRRIVNGLLQPRLHLRIGAIANGLHEQVT